jgi:enoyl-CoA hydratase
MQQDNLGAGAISTFFECLDLTVENGIAEIRMKRPTLLNRFDVPAHTEFVAALELVAKDVASIRVLIISAEGKAFSAGGDFEEMIEAHNHAEVRDRMSHDARAVFNGIVDLPIPVISAVQGAAIGLGATIATLADIVVAWRGAKIADTHVNIGIVAGDGGIIAWSQSIGVNRAKRYLLTGDIITAEQAYDFGLVTELVDTPEEVIAHARAMAERIKALPAGGVNGTKRAFTEITRKRASEAFETGLALEMESFTSPDVPATIERMRKR